MIKLLVCDLDGTLTDGGYHISSDGTVTKRFNTKDFYALEQIQAKGVQVLILTGATDSVIDHKIAGLPARSRRRLDVIKDSHDKLSDLRRYIESRGFGFNVVAYIGDADNDLVVMEQCAITGCPLDATDIIKAASDFISDRAGGYGAVYDFVQYVSANFDVTQEVHV